MAERHRPHPPRPQCRPALLERRRFRTLFPRGNKEIPTMDQLKTQLAAVKQHSFWVMCLGILGVSLGSWWVSTTKLASEPSAQVSKIKGGDSAVQEVTRTEKH